MLTALGRSEWIAEDQESFVAIARQLGDDPAALRQLRTTLRAQVLASALCDGADMGLMFDGELKRMALHHNSSRCVDAH
jgi:predicted O-linked N-acetylglucosamine transferase (SPINDLY family)